MTIKTRVKFVSRREMLAGCLGVASLFGLGLTARFSGSFLPAASRQSASKQLLRPPGGQDEAQLLSACIRCDRCRQICPMQAIESASIEDGLLNVRTPKMNFRRPVLQRTLGTNEYHSTEKGYCNFCDPENEGNKTKKCVACCPTGALSSFDEKHQRLGDAVINPIFCINFPQLGQTPTGCRVCIDACPYEAIVLNEEQRPQVITEKCNGCGKCEAVCPSATYRQMIGLNTLSEKAQTGDADYLESLEYYYTTGKIPRGVNVCVTPAVEELR